MERMRRLMKENEVDRSTKEPNKAKWKKTERNNAKKYVAREQNGTESSKAKQNNVNKTTQKQFIATWN